jgi:hypothetical protein
VIRRSFEGTLHLLDLQVCVLLPWRNSGDPVNLLQWTWRKGISNHLISLCLSFLMCINYGFFSLKVPQKISWGLSEECNHAIVFLLFYSQRATQSIYWNHWTEWGRHSSVWCQHAVPGYLPWSLQGRVFKHCKHKQLQVYFQIPSKIW